MSCVWTEVWEQCRAVQQRASANCKMSVLYDLDWSFNSYADISCTTTSPSCFDAALVAKIHILNL